jgi:hypothetical protein
MNSLETWTTFFGWLTVVNIGIYLLTLVALMGMRSWVHKMNAKMFGIGEEEVANTSFKYIGAYKLLIAVFCFAPWLALKLMA